MHVLEKEFKTTLNLIFGVTFINSQSKCSCTDCSGSCILVVKQFEDLCVQSTPRLRRTRSAPARTVRLREVSALEEDEAND